MLRFIFVVGERRRKEPKTTNNKRKILTNRVSKEEQGREKQQQKSSKQAKLAFLRSFHCRRVGDRSTKLVSFIIIKQTFIMF